MKTPALILLVAGLSFVAAMPVSGQEGLARTLEACTSIDDADERLACFDALADDGEPAAEAGQADEPRASVTAGDPEPAAPELPEAGTAPRPLGDDVGLPRSAGNDGREREVYGATLVRCDVDGTSKRTFFQFDNGQVWRQSNAGRLRLDDCDGQVEITRDAFGYKLHIPDEDRTVRVRRVR